MGGVERQAMSGGGKGQGEGDLYRWDGWPFLWGQRPNVVWPDTITLVLTVQDPEQNGIKHGQVCQVHVLQATVHGYHWTPQQPALL